MKAMAALCISLALGLTLVAPVAAQDKPLTNYESQYIVALRNADLDKAEFYVSEGLVDPHNLSSGLTLADYIYPAGCTSRTQGLCTPGIEVFDYLVGLGFDLNAPLRNSLHPISYVCWGTGYGLNNATKMTEAGFDVEFHDNTGFTPLHYCAMRQPPNTLGIRLDKEGLQRQQTVIKLLLDAGADVNARYTGKEKYSQLGIEPGATPLLMAVGAWAQKTHWFFIINQLIEAGADATVVDDKGNAAVNYVGYPDKTLYVKPTLALLELLHKHGADIMHKYPGTGKSMFDMALERGDVDLARSIRAIAQSPR